MAGKPVTIRRERIRRRIGHLDGKDVALLNIALAFVMGVADQLTAIPRSEGRIGGACGLIDRKHQQ